MICHIMTQIDNLKRIDMMRNRYNQGGQSYYEPIQLILYISNYIQVNVNLDKYILMPIFPLIFHVSLLFAGIALLF